MDCKLTMQQEYHQRTYEVPNDSSDVLDLCVRKRSRSPSPEVAEYHKRVEEVYHKRIEQEQDVYHKQVEEVYQQQETGKALYADPPTSTMCFSSPGSQAGSETSDSSMCSDPYYPASQDSPIIQKAKVPRPFKAYPKDPLSLAVGVATAEAMMGKQGSEAYVEFRHRMLSQVQNQNQGTNIKMRRTTIPANGQTADPTYWEKRRKNNEAAKRSRDARRAKEDEIAIRCAYLEQENLKLRYEVAALRNESERMRGVIYN